MEITLLKSILYLISDFKKSLFTKNLKKTINYQSIEQRMWKKSTEPFLTAEKMSLFIFPEALFEGEALLMKRRGFFRSIQISAFCVNCNRR